MKTSIVAALAAFAILNCCGQLSHAEMLEDDFSRYAAGSGASPAWDPLSIAWEINDRAYVSAGGLSLWKLAPFGSEVVFSCDVTVLELVKGEWLVAGIGLYEDEQNYWAVNLVASPEKLHRRRFTEFQESLHGKWLAQGQAGTDLPSLPAKGTDFQWKLKRTYRLEISLSDADIQARILDGGKEVSRFGYRLAREKDAVRRGRPGLRVNGLRTRFDNARVTVMRKAKEPEEKPEVVPWVSRPGSPLAEGTGHFRTAFIDGRWWLLDPEGKPYFDVGTDHIRYQGHWCEKLGYSPYFRNVKAVYADEAAWGRSTLDRLKAWGFNTLTAGHSPSLRHHGMPHILFASFGSSFARYEWIAEPIHWTGFPDVFSPKWERHCELVARRMAKQSRGDPWCIGTFLDNELEWYGKHGFLVDDVFKLGPDRPAKKALLSWLLERWGDLSEINQRLGTHYSGEATFLASAEVPAASEALTEVRDGFLAEIAERYFQAATRALRGADREHLVMGCRFAGRAPEPVLPAAGRYNDVFTINTYPRVDFLDAGEEGAGAVLGVPRQFTDYYGFVRKPMVITEWSFPALDSGLPCKHGAGMRVDTQEQKAACYRIFADAMADLPFVVGYHYFMWVDEPAPGISSTFPEDSNYGLVNEKNEPYQPFVKVVAAVNRRVEARHARSFSSGDLELRRTLLGLEVKNTSDLPARGTLRILAGENSRTESLLLMPRKRWNARMKKEPAWMAELQQWDGTRQRLIRRRKRGRQEITNISTSPLEKIPAVIDLDSSPVGRKKKAGGQVAAREGADPHAAVAYLSRLEPGQTVRIPLLSRPLRSVETIEFLAGKVRWACLRKNGGLFDTIEEDGLSFGRLVFAAHQAVDGHHQWVEANRVTQLAVSEGPEAWLIEAVVEHVGTGNRITAVDEDGREEAVPTGPANYRAALRAVLFKNESLVLARPLWVQSLDARPWELVDAFWFCRPEIGGLPADDEPGGPAVPNYYLNGQFWTDTKRGGCFGAACPSKLWRVNFWKDKGGGFHPDSYFEVRKKLENGERWFPSRMPYLWVYANRDKEAWRKIALRCRNIGRALIAKPDSIP